MNDVLTNQDLKELLVYSSTEQLEQYLEDIHPADILEVLRDSDIDKLKIMEKLPVWLIANVFEEMEEEEKEDFLNLFSELEQYKIVNEMTSDEIADLLANLEPERIIRFLGHLGKEEAEDVKELLNYEDDTAGGLMASEFLAIKETMTVKETLKYLQTAGIDAETAYYLYVLDENDILKGIISLRELVISTFHTKIGEIMHEKVKSLPVEMDQEEVATIFEKYGFQAMPVTDEKGEMLGVITVDDIIEVVREEATEDILRLGGVNEGEIIDGPTFSSVKSRLPWLYVNLVTAILAGATVGVFSNTIDKVVILAAFNPIIAGMGGNAGTQSLTLIVRGIALGEFTKENAKKIFRKEILVGLINGAAIGVVIAIIGMVWSRKPVFGIVVGVSMIGNMCVATIVGYLVPVILKKLKVDPALASAVFVTTFTDVCGFFFFLGLATLLLKYLI
ncbi:magnesium transporter [Clostridium akagii]|uniref:magnesium transporter n=1 Tax=Clostridium akagii TaxID=91623 RepID=UPI00047B62CE|nr:magnesium transporter [Clostridium akagii]